MSADGYFAGVASWGIALLALAGRGTVRFPALVAAAATDDGSRVDRRLRQLAEQRRAAVLIRPDRVYGN